MSRPTRTTVIFTILTNEPIPDLSFGEYGFGVPPGEYLVTEGAGVGQWSVINTRTLTHEEMREALIEAGNDGTFFDEEWNEE